MIWRKTFHGYRYIFAFIIFFIDSSRSITTTRDGNQFEVLQVISHDGNAFTQGLTFDPSSGRLYESTGHYGESDIREIDPNTGDILNIVELNRRFFAEGATIFETDSGEKRLIQISWKEQTGWIYNADDLELLEVFSYETSNNEGWGITYDSVEKEFIVSDGSHWIHFWDRDTLKEKRRISVVEAIVETRSGNPIPLLTEEVDLLNELELVTEDGGTYVLANRWYTDNIYKIDVQTGIVVRVFDMSSIKPDKPGVNVLNGISVTGEEGVYYITGKYWPSMFVVRFY